MRNKWHIGLVVFIAAAVTGCAAAISGGTTVEQIDQANIKTTSWYDSIDIKCIAAFTPAGEPIGLSCVKIG